MTLTGRNPRAVIGAIYGISLLTAVGFGVFGVAVTLYIRSFGISFTALGMIFGLFDLSASLFGVFFGMHSDLLGRKRCRVLAHLMDGRLCCSTRSRTI